MRGNDTKKKSGTDWDRLRRIKDEDIDVSDIPPLDDAFFKNATLRMPENKKAVSLRLDADVLDWFKDQGRGYQTRINAVLRLYMQAKKARNRGHSRQRTTPPTLTARGPASAVVISVNPHVTSIWRRLLDVNPT